MLPGESWTLTTAGGFLVAHRRGRGVNCWLGGTIRDAREDGHFRTLVLSLINEVGWSAQLMMTTRPTEFPRMFGILSTFAHRCDEPGDAAAGKARFRIAAAFALLALRRRAAAIVLISAATFGVAVMCGRSSTAALASGAASLSIGLALHSRRDSLTTARATIGCGDAGGLATLLAAEPALVTARWPAIAPPNDAHLHGATLVTSGRSWRP